MMGVEKEDWNELVRTLRETEEIITSLSDSNYDTQIERSRQSIQAFHVTAAMLGLSDLEGAGLEFENYLKTQVKSAADMDSVAAVGFAVSLLADQMRDIGNGKGTGKIDMTEIMDILRPVNGSGGGDALSLEDIFATQPAEKAQDGEVFKGFDEPTAPVEEPAENPFEKVLTEGSSATLDISNKPPISSRFAAMVKHLGGQLEIMPNGGPGGKFSLCFSGSYDALEKLDTLLAAGDVPSTDQNLPQDNKFDKLVARGKELIAALERGDMPKAQEILLTLSDPQQKAGLYKEIGGLARGLHDSIRSFMNTLDPSLKEMVENKIPDSGSRLEHMLQLTEKAAITTLDRVEEIQSRLGSEQKKILKMRELIAGLKPIGDQAVKKIDESSSILGELEKFVSQHRVDLDVILTAQDYQDLSGQIIQKIMALLKDLEMRLLDMIRTFGVKVETGKKKEEDELYGPAHDARTNTVHSQDEVDSLLAQFGF